MRIADLQKDVDAGPRVPGVRPTVGCAPSWLSLSPSFLLLDLICATVFKKEEEKVVWLRQHAMIDDELAKKYTTDHFLVDKTETFHFWAPRVHTLRVARTFFSDTVSLRDVQTLRARVAPGVCSAHVISLFLTLSTLMFHPPSLAVP